MSNLLDLTQPQVSELPHEAPGEGLVVAGVGVSDASPAPEFVADQPLLPEAVEWTAQRELGASVHRRRLVVMAVAFAASVAVGWWQSSWLLPFAVLAACGAWEVRERYHQPVHVRIDEMGIAVDGHRFSHAELASFDIHRMPDGAHELSIATRRWQHAFLHAPLGTQSPEDVYAYLSLYIPRETHRVSLIDWHLRKS